MTLWLRTQEGEYGDGCRNAASVRQSQHETPITIAITFVVIEDDDMHLSLAMYGGRDVHAGFPHEPYVELCNNVLGTGTIPSLVSPVQRHTLEPTARLITSWTSLASPPLLPLAPLLSFRLLMPVSGWLLPARRRLVRSSRSWAWRRRRQSATWALNTSRKRNPNDLARPAGPSSRRMWPGSTSISFIIGMDVGNGCSREQPRPRAGYIL